MKEIQDQVKVKTIKKYSYDSEDTLFISRQKDIFKEIVDERRDRLR